MHRIRSWTSNPVLLYRSLCIALGLCSLLIAAIASPRAAMAGDGSATFRPAILFNSRQLDDQGFNAQMVAGLERFEARYGTQVSRFTSPGHDGHRQRLREIAEAGFSPILVPSSSTADSVRAMAEQFPATTFITLDYSLKLNNVRSVDFREAEVGYLAGLVAGRKSVSGRLGFVGGRRNAVVDEFLRGFQAGALAVNPGIDVQARYLADTSSQPWDDPQAAAAYTRAMSRAGVDVVFPAAGNSGLGVLSEAQRQGIYAIGVDANQNPLYPGTVLTSAVKRLDQAVYVSLINERYRLWNAPHTSLGLAQGGLELAIDQYNRPLLGADTIDWLELQQRKVIYGVVDPGTGTENPELWRGLSAASGRPTELTVVMPSENHFPYVVGDDMTVRETLPGLVVDALDMLAERTGITINYLRQPHRRGVVSLRDGRVDALISTTAVTTLSEVGRLPGGPGAPDDNRALLSWDWGLYRLNDGVDQPLAAVAAPTASSVAERLAATGVEVYENPRIDSRFEMLLRGRVQAVAAYGLLAEHLLAANPRFGDRVERVEAELGTGYSFLVFSNDFYRRYPEFCELLWNQLSEIRESAELWDRVPLYLGQAAASP